MGKMKGIYTYEQHNIKGVRKIFFFTAAITLFGNLIDGYFYWEEDKLNFMLNMIVALVIVCAVFLYIVEKVKIKPAFAFITYGVAINSIFGLFSELPKDSPDFLLFFLRDSYFLIFILTLNAYIIDKIHAFIVAVIFVFLYLSITLITKNAFLINNAALIILVVAGYAYLIYYTIGTLEKSINDQLFVQEQMFEQNEEIQIQNQELMQQSEEITSQRDSIEKQKTVIENKNIHIYKSLHFAKKIQETILPGKEAFNREFPDHFILFKPKEIVSGDFYWLRKIKGNVYVAAVDCTGHGVPGALVSLVGNNALNIAMDQYQLEKPGEILTKVNEIVLNKLTYDDVNEIQFGMDMALVCINYKEHSIEYAGAFNPLYFFSRAKFHKIKADPIPVGFYNEEEMYIFRTHKMEFRDGDTIYLLSDGLPDQFGGPDNKKFSHSRFRNLLLINNHLQMSAQKELLDEHLLNWQQDEEQLDDILVIGIRL